MSACWRGTGGDAMVIGFAWVMIQGDEKFLEVRIWPENEEERELFNRLFDNGYFRADDKETMLEIIRRAAADGKFRWRIGGRFI